MTNDPGWVFSVVIIHLQVPRGTIRQLFGKGYARTTYIMWFLWFATAFIYYGIILAQSEILEFHKVCGAGKVTDLILMRLKSLLFLSEIFVILLYAI